MSQKQFYAGVLGIESPWRVNGVEVDFAERKVMVKIGIRSNAALECPECGKRCPGYDHKSKIWRHLDTCDFPTYVKSEVLRVKCADHGVRMNKVPWSVTGNRYTALFESLVIDWIKDAPISAISGHMRLSWNAIAGIQARAVERGLAARDITAAYKQLGIDETSFPKHHDYVRIIDDPLRGHVIHVCKDRKKESVNQFYASLTQEQKENIEAVSMDMSPAYTGATEESIPDAENKISFDIFHVAKYLGDAVDKVRRQENRELRKQDDFSLTGTKYGWLRNPENETHHQRQDYRKLRQSSLKTARAWAIKEHAMCLWHYSSRTWAEKAWQRWYGWRVEVNSSP